jgi:antitoxin VapB
MATEYRARTFKSGNSVALRLPKSAGFTDGEDIRIVAHADGAFSLYRESDRLAVLMGLYGAMSSGFMAEGRGDTEQEERDWTSKPGPAAAA